MRWPFGTTSPIMHQAQGGKLTLKLEILADARAPGRIQDEQRARKWSRPSCPPGWDARNLTDLSGSSLPAAPPHQSNMAAGAGTGPARKEPGLRSGAETAPGIPRGCSVGSLPPFPGPRRGRPWGLEESPEVPRLGAVLRMAGHPGP